MKGNLLIIVFAIAVILMVSIQGINEGRIAERQTKIEKLQEETAGLEMQVAKLKEELQPKPYHQPLEQLWISSGCGYRMNPMGGTEERLHDGEDFVAPIGTPVYAVLPGIVKEHWVPPDGGRWKGHPILGGMITIQHEDGLLSRYGHLSKTFVHEGEYVEQGQIIGEVGNNGISTGPHLHWQVIVSPLKYFEGRKWH